MSKYTMDPSDCKRRVAEKWGSVDYRSLGKEEKKQPESESDTDIDERDAKRVHHEVIDLTQSDDELQPISKEISLGTNVVLTPFKLMRSSIYDAVTTSSHLLGLEDIFGDRYLKSCILFSYQFEMDYLLELFHKGISDITVVGQRGTITPITSAYALAIASKLRIIEVVMPPYTCHHSKLIVCIYQDNSCKIFMPSNNFTYAEANMPQQVCWCSPILRHQEESNRNKKHSKFQNALVDYLRSYKKTEINQIVLPLIKSLDFEPLNNVQFIYSTPDKKTNSGLKVLASSVYKKSSNNSNLTKHYFCQTSTIGSAVSKRTHGNIFTHSIIPFIEGIVKSGSKPIDSTVLLEEYKKRHIKPYILYPTVEEIQRSPSGWLSSGWFHFNRLKDEEHYKTLLLQFKAFYKQNTRNLSHERKATPCHTKFYMKSTTDLGKDIEFDNLDWCLYTSSNLSASAWGNINSNPRNYEVGVLYTSGENQLLCKSFNDIIYNRYKLSNREQKTPSNCTIIMVPFALPPTEYDISAGDEAFCMSKDYNLVDLNGRHYEP